MSATLVFLLIMAALVGIPWLVLLLEPKNGRAAMLRQLRSLASSLDFDLDYAEAWEKGAIGLDLGRRKVLLLSGRRANTPTVRDLAHLKTCRIENEHKHISFCLYNPNGEADACLGLFQAKEKWTHRYSRMLRRSERWRALVQSAIQGKSYPL